MTEDKEREFTDGFGELFSHLKGARGGCPQPDVLLDLHDGTLDAETRARIEEHTGLCGRCQFLLTRLEGELDAATRAAAIEDWSNTDRRMTEAMRAYVRMTPKETGRKWFLFQRPFVFSGLGYALSLVFLLITISLIFKVGRLQYELELQKSLLQKPAHAEGQKPTQLARIYANPSTYTLDFAVLRSKPAGTHQIRIPVQAQILDFLVRIPQADYSQYRVQLRAPSGDLKLSVDDLRPDQYSSLQFAVERNALKAGDYVIQVYGMRGQEPELVAEQKILVAGETK